MTVHCSHTLWSFGALLDNNGSFSSNTSLMKFLTFTKGLPDTEVQYVHSQHSATIVPWLSVVFCCSTTVRQSTVSATRFSSNNEQIDIEGRTLKVQRNMESTLMAVSSVQTLFALHKGQWSIGQYLYMSKSNISGRKKLVQCPVGLDCIANQSMHGQSRLCPKSS